VSAVSNQTYDYTKKTTNNSELSPLNDFATAACGPLINHSQRFISSHSRKQMSKNTHLFAVYKISTHQSILRKST
jgi:hypothetical protein